MNDANITCSIVALTEHFNDQDGIAIYDLAKSMFSGSYDLIVPITKKGYGVIDVLRQDIEFANMCKNTTIFSDKILSSREFFRSLVKYKRICLFDDSVKYVRRIASICEKIATAFSDASIPMPTIDAKAVVSYSGALGRFVDLKIENFYSAITVDSVDELRRYTAEIVKFLYRNYWPSVLGASKTFLVKDISRSDFMDISEKCMFVKAEDDIELKLLSDVGVSLWERYFKTSTLCERFGDDVGHFLSAASIEMYTYTYNQNGMSAQLVSRTLMNYILLSDLDAIVVMFWALFGDGDSDNQGCFVDVDSELKFEIVNYIFSMLVTYDVLGTHQPFRFDISRHEEHYGKVIAGVINRVESSLWNQYDITKASIIKVINSIGPKEITLDSNIEVYYNEYLQAVFNKHECSNVNKASYLYNVQGQVDGLVNRTALENKLPPVEALEFPIHSLLRYFDGCYSCVDDMNNIRQDIVRQQVIGKIAIAIRSVDFGTSTYVVKYAKVGETADTLNTSPLTLEDIVELASEGYGKLVNNMALFVGSLKGVVNSKHKEFITKINQSLSLVLPHIIELIKKRNGESVHPESSIYINALKETWDHMGDNEIEQIGRTNIVTLRNLYQLFCDECEITVPYNKETDVRNPYTNMEDVVVPLHGEWVLMMRVRSVLAGDHQKQLSLAFPRPESKKFAMLYKNYTAEIHSTFSNMIVSMLL